MGWFLSICVNRGFLETKLGGNICGSVGIAFALQTIAGMI